MKYELGTKSNGPGCCAAPMSTEKDAERMHYPSLYISGDKKLKLPDEGTAIITFKKVAASQNEREGQDPSYSCELEVHSIDVKGGEDEGMVSVKDAMKDAMRKKLRKGEYEEEE